MSTASNRRFIRVGSSSDPNSVSVRSPYSRMRRSMLSVMPARFIATWTSNLFAQASADVLASVQALKAILGGLELFAGVGGCAFVTLELRLCGGDEALVLLGGGGVQIPHRVPEPLVVLEILLLDGALLLRCHHRDAAMQGGVDLRVLVAAKAIAERCKPPRQLGPEGETGANRHAGVDRPERADMLGPHLPAHAPALRQAGLKAIALKSEADEHLSGMVARDCHIVAQSCHYGACAVRLGAEVKQRVRAVFASSVLTLALLGAATAGPFEDGVAALQRHDNATAIRLLLPLAQMGNAEAQFYVAIAYNTEKDYRQGAMWYRKSADQGYYAAQFDLGTMYELGQGVPQDYVLAYMWLSLVASISSPADFMIKRRDEVAAKMTPGQIAEAQTMASGWMPK